MKERCELIKKIEPYLTEPAGGWVARLVVREPLPPLAPKNVWDLNLADEIDSANARQIFSQPPDDPEAELAIKAGLLLWVDDLERSHSLSQRIPSQTGSYWHGIMHRREPDFGNSKYWFRRVGQHPAFNTLGHEVIRLLQSQGDGYSQTLKSEIEVNGWDPFGFVDRCERAICGRESPEAIQLLEKIQLMEIENLLLWCLKTSR